MHPASSSTNFILDMRSLRSGYFSKSVHLVEQWKTLAMPYGFALLTLVVGKSCCIVFDLQNIPATLSWTCFSQLVPVHRSVKCIWHFSTLWRPSWVTGSEPILRFFLLCLSALITFKFSFLSFSLTPLSSSFLLRSYAPFPGSKVAPLLKVAHPSSVFSFPLPPNETNQFVKM